MESRRLQDIVKPLENVLKNFGFVIDDNPLIEDSTRIASFSGKGGLKVEYFLKITTDRVIGYYDSNSIFNLEVKLYKDNKVIADLYPDKYSSSNKPAHIVMSYIANLYVARTLKKLI